MEKGKSAEIISACSECELISKCQYAFAPHLLEEREISDDGLGLCKMLKESELDINYPYQYGYLKAKCEKQEDEIKELKNLVFEYAYRNPHDKVLQRFIERHFYQKEYENYSLNRKKSAEELPFLQRTKEKFC